MRGFGFRSRGSAGRQFMQASSSMPHDAMPSSTQGYRSDGLALARLSDVWDLRDTRDMRERGAPWRAREGPRRLLRAVSPWRLWRAVAGWKGFTGVIRVGRGIWGVTGVCAGSKGFAESRTGLSGGCRPSSKRKCPKQGGVRGTCGARRPAGFTGGCVVSTSSQASCFSRQHHLREAAVARGACPVVPRMSFRTHTGVRGRGGAYGAIEGRSPVVRRGR